MSKYIYWIKKDLFGCFRIEEIRDKDNETGLKEGGGIEMSTTVLSIYAMHALLSLLNYLPSMSRTVLIQLRICSRRGGFIAA